MKYKSKIVHSQSVDQFTGASSIPIYQTSTFAQEDPIHFGRYEYARGANPTRDALEKAIADLESGECGSAFSSGMAAISSVFLLFKPGDHVVVGEDVYGGTYRILTTIFQQWQLSSTFVDSTNIEAIKNAIKPETKAIYVETPSNPVLKITDLKAVAELGKERGIFTITDNTFMTPYLQRPIELGFDIVIHSATKFLGGHSDLIAGLTVTANKELGHKIAFIQKAFGAILGPMDSWLVLRGIKTLSARMEAQQKSAEDIANWLTEQEGIKRVYYPTLPSHEGKDIHLNQSSGGGAVVSFEFCNKEKTLRFLRSVKLPLLAVSLGGVESILSYPATMSHAAMPEKERIKRGISDSLVRLSVGLEDAEDLKEDFYRALRQ